MAARRRIRGVGAFPGTSADVLGDAEPHDTLVPLVPVAIPGGRRFGSRPESSPGAKSKRLLADRGRSEPDPPLIGVSYASFAAPDMDGPAAENPRALVPSPSRSNPRSRLPPPRVPPPPSPPAVS